MKALDYLRLVYRRLMPLFYARANYRLLLNTSIKDLNLRLQLLASSADYFSPALRPIPIHAPFGKSMLVIAPHQDDEVIGCGGAIALQARSNNPPSILILQDGAAEYSIQGMQRQELAELRCNESRESCAVLGGAGVKSLGFSDLAAEAVPISEMVREVLLEKKVDSVFVPFFLDGHPDHRQTSYIVAQALKAVSWGVRVFCYEVWGFCIPNVIVDIDDVIELKLRALSCFTFANMAVNYTWTTKGANMYRSRLMEANGCSYAECFFELPKTEYIQMAKTVEAIEHWELKHS